MHKKPIQRRTKKTALSLAMTVMAALILSGCGGADTGTVKSETARPENKGPSVANKSVSETITPVINDQGVTVDQTDTSSKIHVAVLLPLSGVNGSIGSSMLNAVTMALFDSYDPRIVLHPFDTKGTEAGTREATLKAIDVKARIVIGPLLSGNVRTAGDLLSPAQIPLIGLSNDRRVAAPGRYLIGFMPKTEVSRVINYTFRQGKTRMAALIPESAYGDRVVEYFGQTLSSLGGDIAHMQRYPLDPDNVQDSVRRVTNYDSRENELKSEINYLRSLRRDLSDQIARQLERAQQIPDPDFDAILIPEGGDLLRTLVPFLPFYEVDPKKIKLMGTGLMSDPTIMNDPPLQGTWFAGVDPKNLETFDKRYKDTFSEEPPRLASLAYDAMGLVSTIVKNALSSNQPVMQEQMSEQSDPIFTPAALEYEQGFYGINGLFRFLPNGENERMLSILEIRSKGLKVIDPAPDEFPAFGYMLGK